MSVMARCHLGDVWPNFYMANVIHLVFRMDDMVGKRFNAGLVNLKSIAEQQERIGSHALR